MECLAEIWGRSETLFWKIPGRYAWKIRRKREERCVEDFRMYHLPTFRAENNSLLKNWQEILFFCYRAEMKLQLILEDMTTSLVSPSYFSSEEDMVVGLHSPSADGTYRQSNDSDIEVIACYMHVPK